MPSSIVAAALYIYEAYQTYAVVSFAINMVASAIISKAFFSPSSYDPSGSSPNPGNRQQVPPATDNKLPVVYGSAWLGGAIIDLSITSDNQDMYYVLALSEVTNNGTDTISFGDCYWGGKKVVFNADGYNVDSLLDESTGVSDTTVAGKLQFYFYKNGSFDPANTTLTQITLSGQTTASGNIIPSSNTTYDLGSTTARWNNIYTGDLHLSNEGKSEGNLVDGTKGNWTLQEGANDLYLINNTTGKKYRFAIEEIK